ncbi:MAG: FlgD immunoglobulin-like domain containing protein, partial [Candidatus Marinimicrobia bacterium]|nr:FlgD immunoglobulin-like domain containing protein [Candidatus Neomarinimicrobiota bacterium]
DSSVNMGETYDYRLADVDYNGNVEYHSLQLMGLSISSTLPEQYVLYQNYPNPFNPVTTIRYDLPDDAYVTLIIHDMMGRRVRTLVDGPQTAGNRFTQWNGTDEQGRPVTSGVYLAVLRDGTSIDIQKMILLK